MIWWEPFELSPYAETIHPRKYYPQPYAFVFAPDAAIACKKHKSWVSQLKGRWDRNTASVDKVFVLGAHLRVLQWRWVKITRNEGGWAEVLECLMSGVACLAENGNLFGVGA
jgi:hypothetical protein